MSDLIKQYEELHRSRAYGVSSMGNYHYLTPHIRESRAKSIIDFGCGQSSLPDALSETFGIPVRRYDPAIPEYASKPESRYDLLLNIDVLEHIPEDEVDGVVADMAALAEHAIIVIDTVPAQSILPNGQNAHVTLHPSEWWQERLKRSFPVVEPIRVRSRRRAAFKTWHSPAWRKYMDAVVFPADYIRYRMLKRKLTRKSFS